MDYRKGNANGGTRATYTDDLATSIANTLPGGGYRSDWYYITDKDIEDKAKTTVEACNQNIMSLVRLWLDADFEIDPDHVEQPRQKYFKQVCKLAGHAMSAGPDMNQAPEPNHISTQSALDVLGSNKSDADDSDGTTAPVGVQAGDNRASKLNPMAKVFTPTATSTKAASSTSSVNVTTVRALSFEERCQNLGLRVLPAPNKKSVAIPAATSFEERCEKIGLRIAPRKN